jgi:hypothetical protein
MADWQEFFLAQAGAAGVLTGLVFVGVSINLEKILSQPDFGLPGDASQLNIPYDPTPTIVWVGELHHMPSGHSSWPSGHFRHRLPITSPPSKCKSAAGAGVLSSLGRAFS